MKFAITTTTALLLTTAAAQAGGIERYNQGLDPLFENGNYFQIGLGYAKPSISGKDRAPATAGGPYKTGNVAGSYTQFGLAYKHQFNEQFSALIMLNEPFGADISYPTAANGGSLLLGGTSAKVSSNHLTAVLRYNLPNNFGVHGGLNISRADGSVSLGGAAYTKRDPNTGAVLGSVDGYKVDLKTDTAVGFVAGVSWEKPEIAARVALTYHSEIDHEFDTNETLTPTLSAAAAGLGLTLPAGVPLPTGKTKVTTPKSVTLDFQTGVAPDTLVFGSIRWVDWSSFQVEPPIYGAAQGSLTDLDDSTTYTLGVGRKFNDNWSGAASISWEKKGDDLVSPLAPTNGKVGITLAGIYTRDNMKITTGINYTKLGDAKPETGGAARADMTDNSAWGVGVRVGFTF